MLALCIFVAMTTRKIVGNNIRAFRKEKNMSQEVLAFSTKLHENYISLVERGQANISIDALEKISKVLKIPIYLFLVQHATDVKVTIISK
jgi:transcriptional regulator with XRE-family HTH domain